VSKIIDDDTARKGNIVIVYNATYTRFVHTLEDVHF